MASSQTQGMTFSCPWNNVRRSSILVRQRNNVPRSMPTTKAMLSTHSSNPALLNRNLQESVFRSRRQMRGDSLMTIDGAVGKTSLLFAMTMMSGALTWLQILGQAGITASSVMALCSGAGIAAFITSIATIARPHWSPTSAPIFAILKGIALGGMSAVLESMYPGLVMNALMITFGTAGTLFAGYSTRVIKVTDRFRDTLMMVTGGYCFAGMSLWILSMFGVRLHGLLSGGPLAIGFSLLAAGLAASNVLLDFDIIRSAANQGAPKWFEWYGGFSLLLTMAWMYTEILRLLIMMAGGRRED